MKPCAKNVIFRNISSEKRSVNSNEKSWGQVKTIFNAWAFAFIEIYSKERNKLQCEELGESEESVEGKCRKFTCNRVTLCDTTRQQHKNNRKSTRTGSIIWWIIKSSRSQHAPHSRNCCLCACSRRPKKENNKRRPDCHNLPPSICSFFGSVDVISDFHRFQCSQRWKQRAVASTAENFNTRLWSWKHFQVQTFKRFSFSAMNQQQHRLCNTRTREHFINFRCRHLVELNRSRFGFINSEFDFHGEWGKTGERKCHLRLFKYLLISNEFGKVTRTFR